VRSRKFYAVLPHRLDRAEADWHGSQPENQIKPEFIDHEPDGSEAQSVLGGPIQARFTFLDKDE